MKTPTRPTFRRRTAAILATAAIGLTGVVAFGGIANAAEPYDLPATPGSLTIHKYAQPATAGPGNESGRALDGATVANWQPLGDVTFEIQRITTVDLATAKGWSDAAAYAKDPATIPAGDRGQAETVTTAATGDDFGQAVVENLEIGAYLVSEVHSPKAVRSDSKPANIVIASAPFVVTVPVPLSDGQWNTDVHVYPKNSVTAAEKTAAPPFGPGLGEKLWWTIDVVIPHLVADEELTSFEIIDAIDAKLEYVADNAFAYIDPAAGERVTLTLTESVDGDTVTLRADEKDLETLAAHQGETLHVNIQTAVVGAGSIVNTAAVHINDPEHKNGITPRATTYWGALDIVKHVTGDMDARLAGAEFTVHTSKADAEEGEGMNPIRVIDAQGEFTTVFRTDEKGVASIRGLYLGNGDSESTSYWLREVKAPAGYVPLDDAVEVVLKLKDADAVSTIEIGNAQQPALRLPATGGDGTALLISGGIALMVTAAGLAILLARRNRAHAAEAE